MRAEWFHLDKFRLQQKPYISPLGSTYGAFSIPHNGHVLNVIASGALEGTLSWEHVSVHAHDPVYGKDKTPTWDQMCFIKSLFWLPSECVVQLHPPEADYISIHDHVLHLWRSTKHPFPMPPKICV